MSHASGQLPILDENPHSASQFFDDFKNEIRKLSARWNNRLTLEGQSIAKLYIDDRFAIVCDFSISTPNNGMSCNSVLNKQPTFDFQLTAIISPHSHACHVGEMSGGEQSAMLVFDIEVVNMQEGFSVPSSVRFNIYDQMVQNIPRNLLFKSAINGRFKFLPGFIDRELGVLSTSPPSNSLDIVDSQVQSTAQIVNNVPKNQVDSFGTLIMLPDLKKIAGAIRVVLDERNVKVTIEKSVDFAVQIKDVFFGPFNL